MKTKCIKRQNPLTETLHNNKSEIFCIYYYLCVVESIKSII